MGLGASKMDFGSVLQYGKYEYFYLAWTSFLSYYRDHMADCIHVWYSDHVCLGAWYIQSRNLPCEMLMFLLVCN